MRGAILLAVLVLGPASAGAQTTYKCLDGGRRITYSNISCDKQGLSAAGTVEDRVTSMPFIPPPKPAPAAAKPPAPKDEAETAQRGAQVKPVVPLLEKLSK